VQAAFCGDVCECCMCPPDDVIFNNRAIIFGIVHSRGFYRCNLAK